MPPQRHQLLSLLLTVLTIQWWCISHTTNAQLVRGSSKHALIKNLTNNYPQIDKLIVPRQQDEAVQVNVTIYLTRLIEVDRDKQSVSFRTWNQFRWRDDFLTWDPEEFQGLTRIELSVEKMWIPDIAIFDVVSEKCTHTEGGPVYFTGDVFYVPTCLSEISCQMDTTLFPFDKQTCDFSMGSWLYNEPRLVIGDFSIVDNGLDFDFEWEIDNITWKHFPYLCDNGSSCFSYVITFLIHHKAPLFAFLLILPAALLSMMTSVVFLVPSFNENKIELGLSIFLSFMVLLNLLMDAMPGSSSGMPLLGYYFTVNSLLIAMSVFCSTIVLRIYGKSVTHKKMVPRLKTLTVSMAKMVRMKTERRHTDMKKLDDLTPTDRVVNAASGDCTPNTDWILLASVLNRFFFLIYIVINVITTLVIFIKLAEDTH